jgi:putative Mg2+ transporter-C (MgtC) family protein
MIDVRHEELLLLVGRNCKWKIGSEANLDYEWGMSALTEWEMLLRVLMAFVAGAIVGWERESHGRPAGLRTTILTCVAAAVAMVVSQMLFVSSAAAQGTGSWRPDPARLGAGILTGIGFLGAGTILRQANVIRGVTTAATLWFVTVLGLTFGCGQFVLGLIGLGLALLTLFVLPPFEKHIASDWYARVTITGAVEPMSERELRQRIEAVGAVVKSIRLSYDVEKKCRTVVFEVKLVKRQAMDMCTTVVKELSSCPGVQLVRWN